MYLLIFTHSFCAKFLDLLHRLRSQSLIFQIRKIVRIEHFKMKSASQPFFEHRVMTQRTTVKETLAVTGTGHLANRPLPPTCK